MGLTPAQLEERRAYLGGTDAAALAGVNPPGWAQPIDVYLDKVGLAVPRPTSSAMSMGNLMEPVVAAAFTQATGIRLRRAARVVRSQQYPWAGGHLDRWALDGCVFEAKWAMRSDGWGPGLGVGTLEAPVLIPGPTDSEYRPVVPLHFAVQVQHYLAVTGRELGYLAVLLGYNDFRWYALWRNERTIAWLMELEERFWRENVLAHVPPAPDGSEAYGRHLRRAYASDDTVEAVATPEQALLARQLRELRAEQAAMDKVVAKHEQRLQLTMGTTAKLVGDGFTINWRQNKPTLKVQWEALATHLLGMAAVPPEWLPADLPAKPWDKLTKKARAEAVRHVARALELADTEPGARPFRVEFDGDEQTGQV